MAEEPLRAYFEPGRECEVLGMRLVLDPERAEREFRKGLPKKARLPRIFVLEPGPIVNEAGLKDLKEGDAILSVGGNQSIRRRVFVDTPATLVSGLAANHHTAVPTKVAYSGKGGLLSLSEKEAAPLKTLRDELAGYALEEGLPWKEPEPWYEGGPYWLHLLKCWYCSWRQRERIERNLFLPTGHGPVHTRWWCDFLSETPLPDKPCRVILRGERGQVVVEAADGISSDAAEAIGLFMSGYDVGSVWWLFRTVRKFAKETRDYGQVKVRRPWGRGMVHFKVEMLGRYKARVEAEKVSGEEACCSRKP